MKRIGIWIDHRRAVMVTIDRGAESLKVIEGDIERHARPSGGWRSPTPYGPQAPFNEKRMEDRYRRHVVNFYKEVIKASDRPDQLLLIGPNGAKREFAEQVEKVAALRDVPVKLEAADKMTDGQVAAMVRNYSFE